MERKITTVAVSPEGAKDNNYRKRFLKTRRFVHEAFKSRLHISIYQRFPERARPGLVTNYKMLVHFMTTGDYFKETGDKFGVVSTGVKDETARVERRLRRTLTRLWEEAPEPMKLEFGPSEEFTLNKLSLGSRKRGRRMGSIAKNNGMRTRTSVGFETYESAQSFLGHLSRRDFRNNRDLFLSLEELCLEFGIKTASKKHLKSFIATLNDIRFPLKVTYEDKAFRAFTLKSLVGEDGGELDWLRFKKQISKSTANYWPNELNLSEPPEDYESRKRLIGLVSRRFYDHNKEYFVRVRRLQQVLGMKVSRGIDSETIAYFEGHGIPTAVLRNNVSVILMWDFKRIMNDLVLKRKIEEGAVEERAA